MEKKWKLLYYIRLYRVRIAGVYLDGPGDFVHGLRMGMAGVIECSVFTKSPDPPSRGYRKCAMACPTPNLENVSLRIWLMARRTEDKCRPVLNNHPPSKGQD